MKLKLLAFLLLAPLSSQGSEHLILVGGGTRPPEALKQFVELAKGPSARILIISWATQDPASALASIQADLLPLHPQAITQAASPLTRTLSQAQKTEFGALLQDSTGVFFTGGDQNRIMDILDDAPELKRSLQAKYHSGTVFGGTSAGTAIMSDPMLTGHGDESVIDATKVELRAGLGLLPRDTIVDQHFIKRQRENRLMGLVLAQPSTLGIGVDQDTAFLIENGRIGTVTGIGQVMMIQALKAVGTLKVTLVKPGEHFEMTRDFQ